MTFQAAGGSDLPEDMVECGEMGGWGKKERNERVTRGRG